MEQWHAIHPTLTNIEPTTTGTIAISIDIESINIIYNYSYAQKEFQLTRQRTIGTRPDQSLSENQTDEKRVG